MNTSVQNLIECPVCGNEWKADNSVVVGELVDCSDCGTELEITGLNPLAVAEAPQEEEDWGQ